MVPLAALITFLAGMALSLTQFSKTMPSFCFFSQHFVCFRFKIPWAVSFHDKVCVCMPTTSVRYFQIMKNF